MLSPSPSFSLSLSHTHTQQMARWLQCSTLLTELSIKALSLISRSILRVYSAASEPHPLFSAAAAAGVVFLLYLPQDLRSLLLSPVLLSTLLLLAALLRYGSPPSPPAATMKIPQQTIFNSSGDPIHVISTLEAEMGLPLSPQKPAFYEYCYQRGNRGGPLEIIYEEYEGGETEEENGGYWPSPEYSKLRLRAIKGFCYSDSDVDKEEFPESLCFQGDEEGDDLIEIELDEDNMFEIDISACM